MASNDFALEHSSAVNLAAGMVRVQADCSVEAAFVMMNDRAKVSHMTLDEIAAAVLDRSIRFG